MNGLLDALGKGWVGTIIGVAGIVIAFVLYVKSKTRPRLVWQHYGWHLIGGAPPVLGSDVEVRFRGEIVPRVTLSQVIIWNAGTATVTGNDIVESDQLRLVLPPGTRVLQARLRLATRPVNAFSVRPDAQNAVLAFDFLDPGDGALVSVLHTSETVLPQIAGTVRGLPAGPEHWGEWNIQARQHGLAGTGAAVLGVGLLAVASFVRSGRGGLITWGAFALVLAAVWLFPLRRTFPAALSPFQKKAPEERK
jgi:hypothetical protein